MNAWEPLEKDDVETLHAATLKLIETTGIKIHSEKALSILTESGASVNVKSKVAKIPSQLVERAIELCPKSVRLCGRRHGSGCYV